MDANAAPPPKEWQEAYKPTQNLAPGSHVAVVVCGAEPQLRTMRWGLVSSSNRPDLKPDWWRQFNARSETVDQLKVRRSLPKRTAHQKTRASLSPSAGGAGAPLRLRQVFSRLLHSKRVAVPLDGWFEWTSDEFREVKTKQPFYVHPKEDQKEVAAQSQGSESSSAQSSSAPPPVLWAAGLHDRWCSAEGPVDTFTLCTREAAPELSWLHSRMPVLLDSQGLREWLSAAEEPGRAALARCAKLERFGLAWHPVTKKMSSLGFQSAEVVAPVRLASEKQPSVVALFGKRPASQRTPAPEQARELKLDGGTQGAAAGGAGSRQSGGGRDGSSPGSAGKKQRLSEPRSVADFFSKK